MADNFTKVLAATVLEKTGSNKFKLADKQLPTLLSILTEETFIGSYGSVLEVQSIASGSVTYNKNVAGALQDKPVGQIGAGTTAQTRVGTSTIMFDKNKMINEGLSAWDSLRGLQEITAKKLAKFLDQIKKDWERTGIAKIKAATTAQANSVNLSKALTAEKKRALIIKEATKLTKTKDDSQGLDLISRSHIIIDLEPLLFDELVAAAVIGDLATKAYTEGRFSIGTMGGYTVRSNFYLEDIDSVGNLCGIVTTDFAFGTPLKIVAANVEKLPLSNDMGIYVESGYGAGFVYDKVMTRLVAAA